MLVLGSLSLVLIPLVLAHGQAPKHHHQSKRMLNIYSAEGVVNHDFLQNDMSRSSAKFAKGAKNYKINFSHANGTVVKRHLDVLEQAAQLEKRSLEQGRSAELRKRASTGSVPLTSYYSGGHDQMYFGQVGIGSPSQTFDFVFDSGSADMWIPSPKSSTSHSKFRLSSSTLETSTAAWDLRYGTGESQGFLARDNVQLGGMAINKQIFALADKSAAVIEALPSDGLLGLGFSTIATSGAPTPFENLISQGLITSPIMGLYLHRARDLTTASRGEIAGGELCVGCTDPSHYSGQISYVPVTTRGYWEIACEGVLVDGAAASPAFAVAIDSGTTLMYVPRTVAKALYSKIGGKERGTTGEFVVPCSATFSTLAFSFGGVAYGVPLSDLYLGYAEAGNKVDCIIGIMGVDQTNAEGKPVAILGAGFLRSVYTVLSYSQNGAPAVGFAISAGTTALSSSSSPSSSGKSSPSPAFVPTAVAVVTSVPVDSAVVYKPETSAAAFGGAGGAAKVAVSGSATAGVAGGFTFEVFAQGDVPSATGTSSASSSTSNSSTSSSASLTTPEPAVVTQLTTSFSPEDPSPTSVSGASRLSVGSGLLLGLLALVI